MYPISSEALNFVRKTATSLMSSECVIERVNRPSFDQSTGTATPGSKQIIYEGPCRVWEVAGGGPILISDEDITMQSTQISIPFDVAVVPRRDDEIEITACLTDSYLVGKRFVIDSSAKAGELRPTRRFSVRSNQ